MTEAAHPRFVDFSDVWLAYNDELLQKGQFAVEAIASARLPQMSRRPSPSASTAWAR